MCTVGEKEAKTQKRVAEFFLNALDYAYLGFWSTAKATATWKRPNSPIG